MVNTLKKIKTNIWVISGDGRDMVVSAAYLSSVLTEKVEFLCIDEDHYDNLKYQIKSYLL